LPAVSVEIRHRLRWNGEIVGQEVERLAGLNIVVADIESICNCMLRLCYARKKQVFQAFMPFSEAKFRLIMRYFTHDLPASKIAAQMM